MGRDRKNDTTSNRTPRMPPTRKTREGKAAAARNAIKHGLLSKDLIITKGIHNEKQADFDKLVSELWKDLEPEGRLEELLVERIATIWWRMRRSARLERSIL